MADQVGDSLREKCDEGKSKNITSQNDNETVDNYPYSYPLLMEQQIRKLRHSLESWKEVIIPIQSVFLWEQQWHPTALVGASTIIFMLLWLTNPSILTIASLCGLIFTLCDYLVPSISSSLLKNGKWTAKMERDFEDLCTNVVLYRAKFELAWASYYNMRFTNRKLYFILTTLVLSISAWIGCNFSNLFLGYLLVTFMLLYPGMEHNGMIAKYTGSVCKILGDLMSKAKARVAQEETLKKDN